MREHAALRDAIGGECPSVYAAYRFAAKLRAYSDLLEACIARVLDRCRAKSLGGGFYGKVHAAVCARTDLPVAWQVETAGEPRIELRRSPTRRGAVARLRRRDDRARHRLRQ